MKKLTIVFFIILLLALSGCSRENSIINRDDIYKSHEQPIAEFEEVYTLGLYNGDKFEYERTFNINNESFKRSVVLGNKTSQDSSFILLIFNHGEQIEFTVGDSKISNNYSFNIKSGEYMNLEVSLLNLKDGFNSITYIILKDPKKFPDRFETSMELADLFSIRVNLLKNIDNIPVERPNLFTEAIKSENRKVNGVLISNGENLYEILYKEEINKKNIRHNLIYGNSNSKAIDFYIIGLFNFQQTPLNGKTFIYDTLKPDEEKSIYIDFDIPLLEKKNNSFQILMIPIPFEPISKENPFLFQDPLASNRVLLLNN